LVLKECLIPGLGTTVHGTSKLWLVYQYKSSVLTVLHLAKKAVTLLAITSTDRCSDLAVLCLYLEKTAEQVASMSLKPVFVTSRKPIHRAGPGTIGHWIKDTLRLAGIDTEVFPSHATTEGVPHFEGS